MTKPRCTPIQPVNIARFPLRGAWTNPELEELVQIETKLRLAGLIVELDLGTSDEGDPWCVVCGPNGNDVLAHFARIDGSYIGCWRSGGYVRKSDDLNAISEQFLNSYCEDRILTLSDARVTAMSHFQNLQAGLGFFFSNDGQGGT